MRPGGEAFLIQQNSPTQYEELKKFVVERLVQQEDMNFEDLVEDKRRRDPGLSYDEAVDELVADACEMMLKDSKAVEQLAKENRSLAQRIADWLRKWVRSIQAAMQDLKAERPESRAMLQYAQELQKLWDDALIAAARNNQGVGESHERNSIRNVAGVSGKDYGVGVYLDSALLENLTDTERIQMVKERIRELGGKHFAAYNMSGEKVDVQIAEPGARFVNKSGKSVPVNNDLVTKNRKFAIKQETVVLADEMISAARHKKSNPARYSHGWLDNNGQNDWEEWKTYVQDRGGSVWEATLHIATAKTGQKYLYDIDPIKMVEQSGKSDTSTTNHSIRQSAENSQAENSGGTKFSLRDNSYMSAVERGDMDEAQKLVDEAAREAGYTYHLYHGTGAEFNVFDIKSNGGKHGTGEGYGIYLASSKQTAGAYGDRLIDAYVKFNRTAEGAKKTLSLTEVKRIIKTSCEADARRSVSDGEYDSLAEALKDTWVSNYVYTYDYTSMTGVYADVAKMLYTENENDGDIINEIMSVAGAHYSYGAASAFYRDVLTPATGIDGFHYTWGQGGDVYLAFDSEQIKSAETVTRDNSGKVISLSERFNDAEPDIRFSKRESEDKAKTGIKDQIKEHAEELADKPAVANVRVDSLNKMSIKEKRRWAEKVLQETGYKIDRQGFGTISFEPRHINQGLNYLKYDGEIAAFAALPRVLKRGEIIDRHENHKGRNFGTVTIAAPVIVNGVRGNMAVVVQMTGKNHYHTHRILMPDGSMFEFAQKNSTDSKPAGATLEKSAHATPMDSVPNGSVPQTEVKSQAENSGGTKFSLREQFPSEIDQWDRDGRPEGERFTLGSTGAVLQGLGAIESDIYMEGDKISTILREHPEMTLEEIKKIPRILEDPALVLKSKTRRSSIVVLGTYRAQNGKPILAAMDLRPRENGFIITDMQKVASAYTKTESKNMTAEEKGRQFLKSSDVLFLDKKRATAILRPMGIQAPIELLRNGYIGSISYKDGFVNTKGVPFSSVVKISEDATPTDGQEATVRNQQRESKLSDRSVLSLAAEMALRQKNPGWTLEDRNRLEIFSVKLWRVRDAEAELKALREEREVLLAGRKMAEVKGEERDADFSLYKSPRLPYNKGKRGREHGRIIYSR